MHRAAPAIWSLALLASVLAPPRLAAQDTPAAAASADEEGDIVVIGDYGASTRLTADSLRDAARAFMRHRAEFAPEGVLYLLPVGDATHLTFALRQRRPGVDGERAVIPLELDSQGRLPLPAELLLEAEWELRIRGQRGRVQLRPLVLSPDGSLEDRRMGDIRLQCRVAVAFARLGPLARGLANALEPCESTRLRLYARMPRPALSASVTPPEQALEVREDGLGVRMPFGDPAISNEARLRIVFRP